MTYKYEPKPKDKLQSNFSQRKDKNSFSDFNDFYNWYNEQNKECHYCGLKEEETQEIVMKGLLKSNRFPENGIIERGRARGVWLEVDRLEPQKNYSRGNCVLCCYFCNNDKSDVFNESEYKKFMENRVEYLRGKLNDNR